jgi:hypothetical protein
VGTSCPRRAAAYAALTRLMRAPRPASFSSKRS